MTPPSSRDPLVLSVPWLTAALLVWVVLCFGHGLGLDIVGWILTWARLPGSLSETGGQGGAIRAEQILALLFLLAASGTAVAFLLRVRHHADGLPALLAPWVLWGALVGLAWKTIIVYTTELVHFAQYALIATLLSLALDRGRRPQLAFAGAFFLGIVDEIWQHYGLHVWVLGERLHYLDWSDPLLNGLGACGGALLTASWMRLTGGGASDAAFLRRAFVGLSALLLPVLLVDPVTLTAVMGSYSYYPFWQEFPNLKPVHWMTPYEGVPLVLAAFLFLGTLVDPRRPSPSVRVLAVVALLVLLFVRPPSRSHGQPVHEPVPRVVVPWVELGTVVLDGSLEEAAWSTAPRLGPFVNNATGGDDLPSCDGGSPMPLQATHARLLWDEKALLIAFEVDDRDVWYHPTPGERTPAEVDEGIHVMVDDGGDEVTFYEFTVNAANRVSDRFQFIPSAPVDYNPWGRRIGLPLWDAEHLETAVSVAGEAEEATTRYLPPVTQDLGYTVEMAIPWEEFRTTTVPSSLTSRTHLPPEPGERWRLGLYRIERPRTPVQVVSGIIPAAEAAGILGGEAQLQRALASRRLTARDDGFSREEVWNVALNRCTEFQAWSATLLDMERTTHFGVIELAAAVP